MLLRKSKSERVFPAATKRKRNYIDSYWWRHLQQTVTIRLAPKWVVPETTKLDPVDDRSPPMVDKMLHKHSPQPSPTNNAAQLVWKTANAEITTRRASFGAVTNLHPVLHLNDQTGCRTTMWI